MSDDEFARALAPEYLGKLHQITAIKKTPAGNVGVGTLGIAADETGIVNSRESTLKFRTYPKTDDKDRAACKVALVEIEGRSASDERVKALCVNGSGNFQDEDGTLQFSKEYVMFEMLLKSVKDEAAVKALRTEFAKRIGWTREGFMIEGSPSRWASQLTEVPVAQWSYRTLRFAARYAKQNTLDAGLVSSLEGALAKAPHKRCATKHGGLLIRDYQGGAYAAPRFDWEQDFDKVVVDCKKAKAVKSEPGHLSALRKKDPGPGGRWLAVKPTGSWTVLRNDIGAIRNQNMAVDVYWEEEN